MAAGLLIVDDHPGFRSVARAMLERQGLEVVGEASDRESALQAAAALGPQVVLLDVYLSDDDGFAVAEALARAAQGVQIILISSRAVRALDQRLVGSAAIGFISKEQLSAQSIERLLGS